MPREVPKRTVMDRVVSLRLNVIELVFVAVLLGLGVGLAAISICDLLDDAEVWGLLLGIVAAASSFFYLGSKYPRHNRRRL
jgi:O-antigen/teichoic acid export membrane protein